MTAERAEQLRIQRYERSEHLRQVGEANGNERLQQTADRMEASADRQFERRVGPMPPAPEGSGGPLPPAEDSGTATIPMNEGVTPAAASFNANRTGNPERTNPTADAPRVSPSPPAMNARATETPAANRPAPTKARSSWLPSWLR